ncbi:uncharacterized protein LOC114277101 [Camellia sinensis]|uniref:uncharacterized protein LOC114277101 n=1 Tax=Camellia sinensis TaxID=4442 RepID=UPI001035ED18|nr:uncharacterized protein LOC114277101 [Camellia sinensis]
MEQPLTSDEVFEWVLARIAERWNQEVFGQLEVQKASTLSILQEWDEKEERTGLSTDDVVCREGAQKDYGRIARMKDISYRQKSRCLWLKDGDWRLWVNWVLLSSEVDIRNGIVGFYQHLFRDEGEGRRLDLEGVIFDTILDDAVLMLECRLRMRRFGVEVKAVLDQFYQEGQFEKSLNATFIALIPKKGGAEDIREFWPISLLGSVYKLLAKVLANRLRGVLEGVVSESQNAFVGGRQILDAMFVANECVNSWVRQGNVGIMCKLDIEKAYDIVNWNFLFLG